MLNPYDVLGISDTCELGDVKKAYRRMAQKYHPDKSKHPDAAEKFKLIKEAYDFIKTGKSSTGAFKKPAARPPDPYPWAMPPRPSYAAARVKLKVKFNEIFGNSRVQIPGSPYFIVVPNSVQNGAVLRLLAETANHSHQMYFDIEFALYDPTGFHKIKQVDKREVLYSQVNITAGDLLSDVVIYLRNINPNLNDVAVKITAKDKIVKVEEAGLPDASGKRGPYYVEPIVEFKPLENERFDTLIALRDKLNDTLNSYYKSHRHL